ncbi:MAG: MFS transporter [Burkholderiaceae bacterium]|nr:MFS transporter [Burkholderiaceae bacterium]
MSSNFKRIVGLSAAFATALNGTMFMPLIVLALSRVPGISESTATAVASAEIGGIALYCLLLPRLVQRAHFAVALGGVLALVCGELATHWADGIAALTVARLLAGLGEGALFSLITADVAAEPEAERIWGQINLVGGVCMGCLLYALSTLPPVEGRGNLFLWIAAFAAVLSPLVFMIRPKAASDKPAATPLSLPKSQIALILLVVVLVYAVQAGQWAVSGYMGESSHIAPATVGLYLALSSIIGFAGAIVPALTRNPAHRLRYVALGYLIMGAALYTFFNLAGEPAFLTGQILVNVGFYMVTPFMTGLLTENDPDGALVMRTLILAMVGAGAGTALAGELFVDGGPRTFSVAIIGVVAVAWVCAIRVFHSAGSNQSARAAAAA